MVEEAWDKAVSSVNLMRSELRWMLERRRTMLLNFLDIELMRALYVIVWSLMKPKLRWMRRSSRAFHCEKCYGHHGELEAHKPTW